MRVVLQAAVFMLALTTACQRNAPQTERAVTDEPFDTAPAKSRRSGDETSSPRRDDEWFSDETANSGIHFRYQNGRDAGQFTILETVGGGVAMVDFDRDDDLDLFFPGGGHIESSPPRVTGAPCQFYRNDGDFRFTEVSQDLGFNEPIDYSHGCSVADYDRDGYPDLFVTCYGRSRLFHNDGGRRFTDVTVASGIMIDGWSTAAAWADIDRDGWPDLYVAGYLDWSPGDDKFCGDRQRNIRDVCPPQNYPPAPDRLFRNCGNGKFEDVSLRAGLSSKGKGLGVLAADFDGDGWIDFYVANDAGPNHLYRGRGDLRFDEVGVVSGSALNEYGAPEGSMGVDFGDFDGDGRGDLWVTNFEMEDNSLYRNAGEFSFTHVTAATGLAGAGRPYVGFGTGFADFDLDGWLDLFVVNGNVFYTRGQTPFEQPPLLFHNDGGRFADITSLGGPYFQGRYAGRGAAVGDLDNDGDEDLVIVHIDAPASVLRNRRASSGWVRLLLRGTASEPAAVGAKIECAYHGRRLVRWIRCGAGYLSQFDSRVVLPAEIADPLVATVTWLGGRRETFRVPLRQTVEIVEGQGAPEE